MPDVNFRNESRSALRQVHSNARGAYAGLFVPALQTVISPVEKAMLALTGLLRIGDIAARRSRSRMST